MVDRLLHQRPVTKRDPRPVELGSQVAALTLALAMAAASPALVCLHADDGADSKALGAEKRQELMRRGESQFEQDYVLQPGDELEVRCLKVPDLNQTLRVRPDGKISLVLLNEIEVAGWKPAGLGEFLTKAYGEHYRNPSVTVIVRNFVDRDVYVGGEVGQPKLVPLGGRLTATAAIMNAGGFKPTGNKKEVLLLRNSGDGIVSVLKVNVEDILHHGGSDVYVRPFDIVYVPKTRVARVAQFVEQNIREMIPIGVNWGFSYVFGQNFQVIQ